MKYFPYIILCIMFIFGALFLIPQIKEEGTGLMIFGSFWFLVLFLNGIRLVKMPLKIIVKDSTVTFIDIFGRESEELISEMREIENRSSAIKIKMEDKKIQFFGDFDGFSRFVEHARKINPSLTTKGC